MSAYVLSPGAKQDLDDLWDYVADEDVNAADRLIELIFDVFEELARFASFRVASFDPKGVQLAIQQAPVAFVDIPPPGSHT